MAKKDTVTFDSPVQDQTVIEPAREPSTENTVKNSGKAGGPPSGFYIYIGPTIRGLIRSGDIYRGDKAHALAETKEAIEKYPLVKTLIIPGDYLPAARLKVKTPGNALYNNYRKLAGK